jgi:hypothetical protein
MTYRPEKYGDMFKFNIEDVKPSVLMTQDGEVEYHVDHINGMIVYDSNGSELSTRHLWQVEGQLA